MKRNKVKRYNVWKLNRGKFELLVTTPPMTRVQARAMYPKATITEHFADMTIEQQAPLAVAEFSV